MNRGVALVTGATGFIGRVLINVLARRGWNVRAAVRRDDAAARLPAGFDVVAVGEVGAGTDWSTALDGVDVVVHLAGRAHVLKETSGNPLEAFREVNTRGTERLMRQAVEHRVRRVVLVSSIGVSTRRTALDRPVCEDDSPNPDSPYAVSKWEAEQSARRIAEDGGIELVIVRPPLVYGPAVRGNFERLLWLVHSGVPVPLGRVRNLRSLIHVENLCDLLVCCAEHPAAAGGLFHAADGEDLSTPDLMRALAAAMNRKPRLFPVPVALLMSGARVLRRPRQLEQLCESLRVDSTRARTLLGWVPPIRVQDGLAQSGRWYHGVKAARGGGAAIVAVD